ncbi:hypothetical protein SPRG_18184, partial [Saprolegnia parasitica CBS 223.65]
HAHPDGLGSVSRITYSNTQRTNVGQNYDLAKTISTGKPTRNVPITKVTLDTIAGSVSAKTTNTYYILPATRCSAQVTGGKQSTT